MRSGRRRLHQWASLLSLTTILLAGLAVLAPEVSANTEPVDLSSVEAIKAYLESKGVDTSEVLVQEGTNNFAGPMSMCPGEGWMCNEPTSRPVIQRTSSTGKNIFNASGAAFCVVVQTAVRGDNSATCNTDNPEIAAEDSALIAQQNALAQNTSNVHQYTSLTSGDAQSLAQAVDIHQQMLPVAAGGGANSSTISQEIYESTTGFAPVTQTQLSSQGTTVDQFSTLGSNYSSLKQVLTQNAYAFGADALQHQNATGTEQYMRNRIQQTSRGGTNTSLLDASTNQYAAVTPFSESVAAAPMSSESAEPVAGVTQVQGCAQCGIIGSLVQHSSGVSTATATLTEEQKLVLEGVTGASQVQYGPITVPGSGDINLSPTNGVRCCSDQTGNPNDSFSVTISSHQTGAGEQHNYVRGDCTTDGTCSVGLSVNQNTVETTESCTGSDCSVAVQCTEGETCTKTDTAAPNTAIVSGPESSSMSPTATFGFTSTEAGGFICALDEGQWEQCSPPKTYTNLPDGSHLFRVSGVDIAGNIDQTPAVLEWVISRFIDTTIDSSPPTFTNKTKATLTFHGTETAESFECKLDSGAWEACSSPKTYLSIPAGTHLFHVRALDGVGADPSPAGATWIVDLVRPTSTFTTRSGATKVGTPVGDDKVTGKAFDDVSGVDRVLLKFTTAGVLARTVTATLTCNANRTSCSWESSVFGLPPGSYTVTKQAFDRAGNHDNASSITIIVI
jgi:hypothetical protein